MIGHNRGMTAIVNANIQFSIKNVGLFKFFETYQSHKFYLYYYQYKPALRLVLDKSKGGAQQFIGLTELRNWPTIVCSLEEQNEIVNILDEQFGVVDRLNEIIDASLIQVEALRQCILKWAFEGSLV